MPNAPKTPMVAFRCNQKDDLERIAAERGISLSELMRQIVRGYIANWPGGK